MKLYLPARGIPQPMRPVIVNRCPQYRFKSIDVALLHSNCSCWVAASQRPGTQQCNAANWLLFLFRPDGHVHSNHAPRCGAPCPFLSPPSGHRLHRFSRQADRESEANRLSHQRKWEEVNNLHLNAWKLFFFVGNSDSSLVFLFFALVHLPGFYDRTRGWYTWGDRSLLHPRVCPSASTWWWSTESESQKRCLPFLISQAKLVCDDEIIFSRQWSPGSSSHLVSFWKHYWLVYTILVEFG